MTILYICREAADRKRAARPAKTMGNMASRLRGGARLRAKPPAQDQNRRGRASEWKNQQRKE